MGRTNLRILVSVVLKTEKLSDFLRAGSKLFYPIKKDKKNEGFFLKKMKFGLRREMLFIFLFEYNVPWEESN